MPPAQTNHPDCARRVIAIVETDRAVAEINPSAEGLGSPLAGPAKPPIS